MVTGISNAEDVAVSRRVCARRTGGALSCWGVAPLGDGSDVGSPIPIAINLGGPVLDVATGPTISGPMHSCVATTSDGVMCWGANMSGQLGSNPATTTYSPDPLIVGFSGNAVCAGVTFSCMTTDTNVRCWGNGTGGELGNGTNDTTYIAQIVSNLGVVEKITCGLGHACVVAAGSVSCWGANAAGQLGNGAAGGSSNVPVQATGLPTISDVSGGFVHTCAVTVTGEVWCWGGNTDGQLGTGDTTSTQSGVMVDGVTDAKAVATGRAHSCAVTNTGRLYCWGRNDYGQLGDGSIDASLTPVEVPLP